MTKAEAFDIIRDIVNDEGVNCWERTEPKEVYSSFCYLTGVIDVLAKVVKDDED